MIVAKREGDTLSFTISSDELMRMGERGINAVGRMAKAALTRRRNILLCERDGHLEWINQSDSLRVCVRCYMQEERDAPSRE